MGNFDRDTSARFPDGVRLFRERAGTRGQTSLDTDRATVLVGEICRRVDGVPLAIEMAAARVAGLDLVAPLLLDT